MSLVEKYFFLSNFYEEAPVLYNGIQYLNSEAAFEAQKTLIEHIRRDFQFLTPSQAQRKGRTVGLRPDWIDVREQIMYEITKAKFTQNSDLMSRLLNTVNEELVNENYWGDTTWGVCNGRGNNLLGKILMRVRNELRKDVKN